MTVQELNRKLDKALDDFSAEIRFYVETFDQNNQSKYLTKDDLEYFAKQVFYCLYDFKEIIVEYAKGAQQQ